MNREVDVQQRTPANVAVSVVIPNWNGKDSLGACLDSLLTQSLKPHIIVVENGSVDGSLEFITSNYPTVEVITNKKNLGFAGGVNCGIRRAMERQDNYVALFNNDAIADKNWLQNLWQTLKQHPDAGIATCKFMSIDHQHLDSTGDLYTVWGLPYPRGRGEPVGEQYDNDLQVFGASGGASLYRVKTLQQIGLFDEDFFAYYEDVDLSFRAQLAGWRVYYAPTAIAYHQIGATSGKIKGFTTYQTIKNYPWLFWKNVPMGRPFWKILPRFTLAYASFVASAIARGQFGAVGKGLLRTTWQLPKKLIQRRYIQKHRVITNQAFWQLLTHDLPANAYKLRTLRARWWSLKGKRT